MGFSHSADKTTRQKLNFSTWEYDVFYMLMDATFTSRAILQNMDRLW